MGKILRLTCSLFLILLILCTAAAATADQAEDFRRIEKAVSSGDMLEAQSLIEDFLDAYPSGRRSVKALFLLGQLHYRRAAYKDAATAFSKILEEHPEWEYADRALFGLAMAQIGMLNYSGASASLERFLQTYRQSDLCPNALYWLGESLYRRAEYEPALAKFTEFLKLYRTHSLREYALDSSAWCLEQLGRYDQAARTRRKFLNEFKNSSLTSGAEFCLAADMVQLNNRKTAAELYGAMARTDPGGIYSDHALTRAGLLLADMGKNAESVAALEQVKPDTTGAEGFFVLLVLGNAYLCAGDYKESKTVFEDLLAKAKHDTGRADAAMQIALADFALGNYKDAADLLSSGAAGTDEPGTAEVRGLLLASSLMNYEKPDAAAEKISSFMTAEETARRSPDVRFAQAGLLILSQQFSRAGEILDGLCAAQEFTSRKPEAYYYRGLCRYKESDYSAAAKDFAAFIKTGGPRQLFPPAYFLLADSYARSAKAELSLEWYAIFLEKWPKDSMAPQAAYRAGLLSLSLKKYDSAVDFLTRAAEGQPSTAMAEAAQYCIGLAYLRTGRPERATAIYKAAMNDRTGSRIEDSIALGYGLAEFEQGNFVKADQIFREFPSRFIGSNFMDAAVFFAAASRYAQGSISGAVAEFNSLTELFPSSRLVADAFIRAGMCEERLNHPENAVSFYGRALKTEPSQEERSTALAGEAFASMSTGDQEAALELFSVVAGQCQKDSSVEQALFWKGRLLYSFGRWNDARETLEDFAKTFPTSPLADDALFFSARAARMEMDYPKAIELFHDLNSLHADSSFFDQAKVEAAECMSEAGETDAAVGEFKEFIENNVDSPLRPSVLYDMGKALQRSGKFEEAIEQFRAAAGGQTTWLAASSRFAIAECLAELDRNDEAVSELVSMVRGAYPPGWAERAQLQVARLLERNGQAGEARQVYEAVAQTYRHDAAGMVARRALDRLDMEKQ